MDTTTHVTHRTALSKRGTCLIYKDVSSGIQDILTNSAAPADRWDLRDQNGPSTILSVHHVHFTQQHLSNAVQLSVKVGTAAALLLGLLVVKVVGRTFGFVVWETVVVHNYESTYLAADGIIGRTTNVSRTFRAVFQQSACGLDMVGS